MLFFNPYSHGSAQSCIVAPTFPNELQTEFASTAVALRYANGECDAEQLKACFDRVACRPNFGDEGLPLFLKMAILPPLCWYAISSPREEMFGYSPFVSAAKRLVIVFLRLCNNGNKKRKENNNEQDSMKIVPTDFVK